MKKVLAILLAIAMLFTFAACGEKVLPESMENEMVKVDGFYVDDAYENDDGYLLAYLFCTLTATGENMRVSSVGCKMKVDDLNEYSSENIPGACDFAPNYYYASYIEDVFTGSTLKIAYTFEVPAGDLTAGKTLTFYEADVPEMAKIKFKTDVADRFNGKEAIGQAADPSGYAKMMEKREPADAQTVADVKNQINGYYWSFYVNSTSYELEFWADNNFELRTSLGTANGGTYTVQKGYIFCTYPNGNTVEVPYTIEADGIKLDTVAAFDVFS